jgi:Carboxypeptidase regulatory-like domain
MKMTITKTKTMKKRKTRINLGSKLSAYAVAAIGCLLLSVVGGAAPQKDGAYAVIAGTIFRDNGFSLAGAVVTLSKKDAPKVKGLQSVSDSRGEFAFRVSPAPAVYIVKASLKGFQPMEKEVSVAGGERVEVTLSLPSESK